MKNGTVKWFNADKGYGLLLVKMATMYSFTSQLSKLTVSRP